MNPLDRARLRRGTRVVADTLLGYVILAAGIVMFVTPGPGLLAVIAGLALLARHYRFADRLRRAAMNRINDAGVRLRTNRSRRTWSRGRRKERLDEPGDGKDAEAA